MKAITTKFLEATNTKGARIKAFDEDNNNITIAYDYSLEGEKVHRKGARALMEKMGWEGKLIGGSIKNGYVFVFVE